MGRPDDDTAALLAAHVKLKTAADLVRWARSVSAYRLLGQEWFDEAERRLKDGADAAFKAAHGLPPYGKD